MKNKYKEICGIYKITNNINNKFYIGKSKNIYKRWESHKSSLKGNRHINKELQKDVNTYGIENFTFEILCICEFCKLNREEDYYIRKYNAIEQGYNVTKPLSYENLPEEKLQYYKDVLLKKISQALDGSYSFKNIMDGMKLSFNDLSIVIREINSKDEDTYDCFLMIDGFAMNENKIINKYKKSVFYKRMEESMKNFRL